MDQIPSIDLLESTHSFPGLYKIKAIGSADGDFESRVVEAVRSKLPPGIAFEHSVRSTQGGRHLSLTLDVPVETAAQVREIYENLHGLPGMIFLL